MTRIFLVAGETSGDHLGARLMRALRSAQPGVTFQGVGGAQMTQEGLASLFPMSDIAVMGLLAPLARLPSLVARINATARAIIADRPDCLVLIDAPDFTHRVARRVRRATPKIPIIDYVSPTVWAWRPGRARAMRAYVDHVLALLPFEPAAHARLGGPPCDYVGHPLIERLDQLTPSAANRAARQYGPLLIMPGSRLAEVRRLMPVYGETLRSLMSSAAPPEVMVPVAPNMEAAVYDGVRGWPLQPRFLTQNDKFAVFRTARAALVTSGAATLELAIAGVPMVVAYKVSPLEGLLKFLVTVDSIVLPNLIIAKNFVPEFLQAQASPEQLAATLAPLLIDSPARQAQLAGFERVRAQILEAGAQPSALAAKIVLDYAGGDRTRDFSRFVET